MRAIRCCVDQFLKCSAHFPQLCWCQPAFKEGFLSAYFVAKQERVNPVQPSGTTDVVADQKEGSRSVIHGARLGRCGYKCRDRKLVVSIPLFSGLHTDHSVPHTRCGSKVSIPLFSGLHTDNLNELINNVEPSQSLCFQGFIQTGRRCKPRVFRGLNPFVFRASYRPHRI